MKFEIYYDVFGDDFELRTISSFLKWQQRDVGIIYSKIEPLKLSQGRSHIFIKVIKDDSSTEGFYNFHQLYEWYDSKGLIQC